MPPYIKNRIIAGIVIAIVLVLIAVGLGFQFFGEKESFTEPVVIEFWGTIDAEEAYQEVFADFSTENTNVSIDYRKIPFELYRQTITEALAAGEGPDIYIIRNTWLPLELRRLVPMNEFMDINPALVLAEFPDVVRFDFSREGSAEIPLIYALPIAIDTLVLYYNADYLNSAGIVNPPATLEELVEYSKRLRRVDEAGNIQLAGIAMGSVENVKNASDILSLLMLQGGTMMNAPYNDSVTFDQPITSGEEIFFPGREAMKFYTSFSDPASQNYTWSQAAENSLEAFINGKAAMMLGYSYQGDAIREQNPGLNFKVAPMPQPAERFDRVNYANYWGLAVARGSGNPEVSWQLIRFLTQGENAKIYLRESGRPPALKSLVGDKVIDEDGNEIIDLEYGIFSRQILTARSWIQQNPFEVEKIMKNAINYVLSGEKTPAGAMGDATQQINSIVNF